MVPFNRHGIEKVKRVTAAHSATKKIKFHIGLIKFRHYPKILFHEKLTNNFYMNKANY